MKALLIPVGEEPREIEVEGLADLQELVGGHIDAAGWVFDDSPALYVNDEGKVNGMLPNRAVYVTEKEDGCQKWDGGAWAEGEVLDILYGPLCYRIRPENRRGSRHHARGGRPRARAVLRFGRSRELRRHRVPENRQPRPVAARPGYVSKLPPFFQSRPMERQSIMQNFTSTPN